MHILQARFTSAHTNNSGASGTIVVVTVDDDECNDDDTVKAKTRSRTRESLKCW